MKISAWWRIWCHSFFVLVFAISTCHALHFYVDPETSTCFTQELGTRQALKGTYKIEVRDAYAPVFFAPQDHVGIMIDVYQGSQRLVHQRSGPSGQFTFNAVDSGQHRICLAPIALERGGPGDWFTRARLTVSLEAQVAGTEVADDPLVSEVRRLRNRLVSIQSEQSIIRKKECVFREVSRRTGERALFWAKIQGIISVAIWVYQGVAVWRVRQKIKKE